MEITELVADLRDTHAAAANGGAYGRAAAWRTIRAMSGAQEDCEWWTFDAANGWFCQVAWDIGVVCLRPDGRMTVLAATDED